MQELKQIKLTDAIGKTIKAVEIGNNKHIILFEDNSFSFFERYTYYNCEYQEDTILKYSAFIDRIGIRPDGSTYFTNTQKMLIDLGVLNAEKLIEDAKERILEYVKNCEEKEKQIFEKLKLKFEDKK